MSVAGAGEVTRAVTVRVNGQRRTARVADRMTLADMLREELDLTGTHLGCEHGVCGACTVLLDGEPVRACLLFGVQAEGCDIVTVEGLAGAGGGLHAVQAAFVEAGAFQCGFCTPGFVVLVAGALDRRPETSSEELRELLASNLCRCTGYQQILAAAESARQAVARERKVRS